MSVTAQAIDRYGGQYDVVVNTSPYIFHYRLYKELGKTGVNEFELRSKLDAAKMIWESGILSECTKWRVINLILEKKMENYFTYPYGVYRDSVPFDENSLVFYTTSAAVSLGLIEKGKVQYTTRFSTIPICIEGGPFPK